MQNKKRTMKTLQFCRLQVNQRVKKSCRTVVKPLTLITKFKIQNKLVVQISLFYFSCTPFFQKLNYCTMKFTVQSTNKTF